MASAWGRPPGCVQPRPITIPSRTTTAPTAGLGRLRGRARSARPAAAASQRASCSVVTRGESLLLLGTSALTGRSLGSGGLLGGGFAVDPLLHRIHVEAGGAAEGAIRCLLALGAGLGFG